jgi:hypothetical protein
MGWSGDRGHVHSDDRTKAWVPVFPLFAAFSILQKLLRPSIAAITAA